MRFSILTYNVLYNNAFIKLRPLLEKYHPDILCLQEVDTDENNLKKLEILDYRLADYSNSFIKFGKIYGVATFYNPEKFSFIKSNSLNLPRSYFEIISLIIRLLRGRNKPRTVLHTGFIIKLLNKQLSIHNIHLSLYGINSLRIKQIKKVLNEINMNNNDVTILTGDFNYFPYSRKGLEELTEKNGLSEATHNIRYTVKYSADGKNEKYNFIQKMGARLLRKFFNGRLKVDYTFYKNIKCIKTKRLDVSFSDHFPIISYFEI